MRNTPPEFLVLFGVLEKVNNLSHFFDSFIDASNIVKCDADGFVGVEFASGSPELHRGTDTSHPTHRKHQYSHAQKQRQYKEPNRLAQQAWTWFVRPGHVRSIKLFANLSRGVVRIVLGGFKGDFLSQRTLLTVGSRLNIDRSADVVVVNLHVSQLADFKRRGSGVEADQTRKPIFEFSRSSFFVLGVLNELDQVGILNRLNHRAGYDTESSHDEQRS